MKSRLKPALDRAYESASEAKVLDLRVSHDTSSPKGLVVVANLYSQPEPEYFLGAIDSVLDNGSIKVRYSYRTGAIEDWLRDDILVPQAVARFTGRFREEVVKKSWDRLPACHFPRISDRLEAYPTQ